MAISYVSGSSTTYASRTNTTITAPSGIADGDALYALLITAGNTSNPPTPSLAGWTAVGSGTLVTGGFGFYVRQTLLRRIASSESGNYTFTHASSTSQGLMLCLRGVDTTTPEDVTPTSNTGTNTTTRTWTGLTTATNGAWIVALGQDWSDTANNLSPPSGMTERIEVNPLVYCATQEITTAGATGNKTHTCNSASSNSAFGAILVAVRPITATNYSLTADAGSHTITGTAASTLRGRAVAASAGALAVMGTAAGLLNSYSLGAAAGSFTITGTDVSLIYGQLGAYTITADTGAYLVTGPAASALRGAATAASAGSYVVTGTNATIAYGDRLTADAGAYTFVGAAASALHGYEVAAESGSYGLTGTPAGMLYGRLATIDAGSYTLTGTAAGVMWGRSTAAEAGAYTINGAAVTLTYGQLFDYTLAAAGGSYSIAGTSAGTVLGGQAIVTPPERIATVLAEARVVVVLGEIRMALVSAEDRTIAAVDTTRTA